MNTSLHELFDVPIGQLTQTLRLCLWTERLDQSRLLDHSGELLHTPTGHIDRDPWLVWRSDYISPVRCNDGGPPVVPFRHIRIVCVVADGRLAPARALLGACNGGRFASA